MRVALSYQTWGSSGAFALNTRVVSGALNSASLLLKRADAARECHCSERNPAQGENATRATMQCSEGPSQRSLPPTCNIFSTPVAENEQVRLGGWPDNLS
jgi:hypothetical protein